MLAQEIRTHTKMYIQKNNQQTNVFLKHTKIKNKKNIKVL